MEGATASVRRFLPCKPSFWQWIGYKRHLGSNGRGMLRNLCLFLAQISVLEVYATFDSFPQPWCHLLLQPLFLPYKSCSSYTLKLPSTGPHHYQALPLSPVLILSQSLVHQVSKSQLSTPSSDFLLVFLPNWLLISPINLISLAFSPSRVFVLDFSPWGLCLSVFTLIFYTLVQPQCTQSSSGPFFPSFVLHSPSYVSTAQKLGFFWQRCNITLKRFFDPSCNSQGLHH